MTASARYAVPSQDRALVLGGLVCVTVLAWMYLLMSAGMTMTGMVMDDGQMMSMPPAWTLHYAALTVLMWTIMMVAMMLPSAARPILLAASVAQKRPDQASGTSTAVSFTAGYLTVWTGFSFAATILQWMLDRAGLLSDVMASRSAVVAGGILLAAGVYQLTSLKQTFLRDCRSPIGSLGQGWSNAPSTFATGMQLGLRCVGCCWALMGLMFVVGVMNVLWSAALALLVLAEKTLPQGQRLGRLVGAALIAWGCLTLVTIPF